MTNEEKGTSFDDIRIVDYAEHCEMVVSFHVCKECWAKFKEHLDDGMEKAVQRRLDLERWDRISKERRT